jgi:uncharacterized membrane protein YoaK (UPF0700 family)
MPFRLGFKSIFLLLFTLSLTNILFTKPLQSLGFSYPTSLCICTTFALTLSLTLITFFRNKNEKEKKKKILPYFLFFLVGSMIISYLIIY